MDPDFQGTEFIPPDIEVGLAVGAEIQPLGEFAAGPVRRLRPDLQVQEGAAFHGAAQSVYPVPGCSALPVALKVFRDIDPGLAVSLSEQRQLVVGIVQSRRKEGAAVGLVSLSEVVDGPVPVPGTEFERLEIKPLFLDFPKVEFDEVFCIQSPDMDADSGGGGGRRHGSDGSHQHSLFLHFPETGQVVTGKDQRLHDGFGQRSVSGLGTEGFHVQAAVPVDDGVDVDGSIQRKSP